MADRKEYHSEWYQRNKERSAEQQRVRYLANREEILLRNLWASRRRKYGITEDEYWQLLSQQNYACAVCGTMESRSKNPSDQSWSVDHDHTTGRVRGLLCHSCNKALGLMSDEPKRLRAAAAYLEDH